METDADDRAGGTRDAAAAVAAPSCANCGASLAGRFCAHCGQESLARPDSLAAFLATAVSDVFSFRSRTLRSMLDLLIRPGAPTAAYFAGRRARYTQPIQLYLIAAALFFLANSFRPFVSITPDNQIRSSLSSMSVYQDISRAQLAALDAHGVPVEVFRERFRAAVSQSLPPFMIGSILAFALALSLFNPRRLALQHMVFALHWTGAFMLLMTIERMAPGSFAVNVGRVLTLIALLHLVLSLRRAYDHSWPRAVLTGFGLFLVFNLILAFWVMAVVSYAVWQVG